MLDTDYGNALTHRDHYQYCDINGAANTFGNVNIYVDADTSLCTLERIVSAPGVVCAVK